MTIYIWSTLTNNQLILFNPLIDRLHFDVASSAADVGFSFSNTGTASFTLSNKEVTLDIGSTGIKRLTTANITFANGSMWVVGDNTTGTAADDGPNTLTGANGNDRLIGLGGNDIMTGGAGDDAFSMAYSAGQYGNDTIDGGTGSDRFDYSGNSVNAASVNLATHIAATSQGTATLTSIEVVRGGGGNDVLIGGDLAHATDSAGNRITETFRGRGGDDTIIGGSGSGVIGKARFFTQSDYSDATSAQVVNANLLTGRAADGAGGTDTLANIDMLQGGAGNDVLTGGSMSRSQSGTFFEVLRGNAGNDTLNGRNSGTGGTDASSDRADYANNTASQAVIVNLSASPVIVGPTTVQAGQANDGRGGTDTLIDIDQIYGGDGNDTFFGGDANDTFDGGEGNDLLNGGGGSDEARFQQSSARVIVNMSASEITVGGATVAANTANDGMGGTDTLVAMENVRGSDFNDHIRGSDDVNMRQTFTGDAGNDFIDGGAGLDFASYSGVALALGGINAFIENGSGIINDKVGGTDTLVRIEGLSGTHSNDTLTGGLGDQWLRGRGGSDTLNGGAGIDWVTYSTDPSGVAVNLTTGKAIDGWDGPGGLVNLGGTDTLVNIENVEGSDYADGLTGNAGANSLVGRDGNDVLKGLGAADVLTGGAGRDRFDFDAVTDSGISAPTRDEITDFSHAQGDKIDLSSIDADAVLAGNNAFTFIGAGAFTGAGQLRFDAATHLLFGSTDADSDAEFSILLTGIDSVVVGDFIL